MKSTFVIIWSNSNEDVLYSIDDDVDDEVELLVELGLFNSDFNAASSLNIILPLGPVPLNPFFHNASICSILSCYLTFITGDIYVFSPVFEDVFCTDGLVVGAASFFASSFFASSFLGSSCTDLINSFLSLLANSFNSSSSSAAIAITVPTGRSDVPSS